MDNVNIGKLVMVSFLYHHAFAVMCIFVRELKIKSVHKYVSEFEENIFFHLMKAFYIVECVRLMSLHFINLLI